MTKEKTKAAAASEADTAAEQVQGAADAAKAPKADAANKIEKGAKADKTVKAEKETRKASSNALESVGKAAIREHGYDRVYVTSDGTTFRLESDARNHAANLPNPSILTVKK